MHPQRIEWGTLALINLRQTIAGLIPKHNLQIFKIYCQKAKDKRAAMARKYTFKLEYMQRKSEAQIVATAAAPAISPTPASIPA